MNAGKEEGTYHPHGSCRVMYLPARFGLFGLMASLTSSVLVIALNAIRIAF